MMHILLVHLYFFIKKHFEDVLLYITGFTGSFLYIIDLSRILEAVIISCISATVPIIVKHIYNAYYNKNEREN